MATFTNKRLVDELMEAGYDDDGAGNPIHIQRVVEYETYEGATAWGVVYAGEPINRYNVETQYIRNPRTIWPLEAKPADPAPGLPPISAGLKAVLRVARASADMTDNDPRHEGPAPNWMHWASGFELGCELARQDPALTTRLVDELTLWRDKVPGALTEANRLRETVAGQIREAARMD